MDSVPSAARKLPEDQPPHVHCAAAVELAVGEGAIGREEQANIAERAKEFLCCKPRIDVTEK